MNNIKSSSAVTMDKHYHDTWTLLKKYRDIVWSLELAVQKVGNHFRIEYGSSIDEFLDSAYMAGANLEGSKLEHHGKSIALSNNMLKLFDSAIETLRNKHKNGEDYYWILYYTYIVPQQLRNADEIVEKLRPHVRDISLRTYFRKRNEAVGVLSSFLWGFTSKSCMDILRQFFSEST